MEPTSITEPVLYLSQVTQLRYLSRGQFLSEGAPRILKHDASKTHPRFFFLRGLFKSEKITVHRVATNTKLLGPFDDGSTALLYTRNLTNTFTSRPRLRSPISTFDWK